MARALDHGLRLPLLTHEDESQPALDQDTSDRLGAAIQAAMEHIERHGAETGLPGILDELDALNAMEPAPRIHIVIGYPLYGRDVPADFVQSLSLLDYRGCDHVWFTPQHGRTQAECREALCLAALTAGASHVLMLDTDMVYPPDTMSKLLQANVDVICGFAVARGIPHMPVFGGREKQWHFRTRYPTVEGTMAGHVLDGVQPSYVVGGAALLIRTSALRRIQPPWFAFDERTEDGVVGEDLYFSEKCYTHNIQTWVHTGVRVGHLTQVLMTPRWDADAGSWTVDIGGLYPFIDPQQAEPPPDAKRGS